MKYLTIISFTCVFALCSCIGHKVQGNGMLRTETRDVPTFETITCDGSYEMEIECQAKQALTIDADENLLPLIKTEVKNNALRIYTEENLQPSKGIKIIASVENLSAFTVHGSALGDVHNINNNALSVEVNGSSKLHFNGKTTQLKITISGSSNIDATSLVAEDAKVRINGSGDIHVWAVNSVDGKIHGSGNVKYSGNPINVTQEINGSGTISKE